MKYPRGTLLIETWPDTFLDLISKVYNPINLIILVHYPYKKPIKSNSLI